MITSIKQLAYMEWRHKAEGTIPFAEYLDFGDSTVVRWKVLLSIDYGKTSMIESDGFGKASRSRGMNNDERIMVCLLIGLAIRI